MKAKATAKFSKKGDAVVAANHQGIDRGSKELIKVDVPESWKTAVDEEKGLEIKTDRPEMKKFVKDILSPVDHQKGDKIPVSKFVDMADGVYPQGSAAFEKRGIAVDVPEWEPLHALSVTDVQWFARTLLSVLLLLQRTSLLQHLQTQRL